jgi:hypothetical protein
MRSDAETWTCIVCGGEARDSVVCRECEMNEQARQKNAPASITQKQVWFIENKCLSKLNSETTQKIFLETIPEYNYDLDGLSTEQGKKLISRFLEEIGS